MTYYLKAMPPLEEVVALDARSLLFRETLAVRLPLAS